ncbi:GNAT family N-acetyltransferase [Halomonas sp. BDJS001]|uniref:GNAT family N-acetyltransferase n=2 Tax=unclassified Halomonas TaxID=2609666 RepID=UPI002A59CD38|nr:GNAT family N-acetyltransferase [Halomonas sp. BDJS001]
MMQPILTTSRLVMTPRSAEDLEACLAMDRDPEVTRYVSGPWHDLDQHRAFVLDRMGQRYPPGLGYWSVRKHDASDFLGWILLIPYEAVRDEVEIGWRFTRASWGQGFATEAAAAVVEHAFDSVYLTEVVADINPMNFPSIRVAEKVGMRCAGNRVLHGTSFRSYRLKSCERSPT